MYPIFYLDRLRWQLISISTAVISWGARSENRKSKGALWLDTREEGTFKRAFDASCQRPSTKEQNCSTQCHLDSYQEADMDNAWIAPHTNEITWCDFRFSMCYFPCDTTGLETFYLPCPAKGVKCSKTTYDLTQPRGLRVALTTERAEQVCVVDSA